MYGFVSSKNQDGYLTYYHPSFSKNSVVMKNIQKKHQKKQDHKSLDFYVSEQTELKDQIMQLQQKQVSLQQNLIASIKSQLKIKESIKKMLQLQLAKEGQRNCEKFIFTTRILTKAMEPISQQEILQFFKQVFPEGAEYQLQPSDFFTDLDANNQSQFSPAPFGKTAFDESYIINRDQFELDSDLFVFETFQIQEESKTTILLSLNKFNQSSTSTIKKALKFNILILYNFYISYVNCQQANHKKTKEKQSLYENIKINTKKYRDIIEQTDDNKGFKIVNIEKFNTIVLPEHFAHQNFDSFRRQLNSYGFISNKNQIRSSEISYINKEFNLESEEVPSKRINIKQPETNIYTELIDLYNQLKQLQMNQQQMIQKIQTMIKIQEQLRDQIKLYLGKFKQKFRTMQKQKFLALTITLYVNIKDQGFKQYIDDLIADADFPFFNFIRSNPSRMGYQQIFSIINYYFRCENLETKLNQQSIQDFQDFDEKQSISNKSNISNYFDL